MLGTDPRRQVCDAPYRPHGCLRGGREKGEGRGGRLLTFGLFKSRWTMSFRWRKLMPAVISRAILRPLQQHKSHAFDSVQRQLHSQATPASWAILFMLDWPTLTRCHASLLTCAPGQVIMLILDHDESLQRRVWQMQREVASTPKKRHGL